MLRLYKCCVSTNAAFLHMIHGHGPVEENQTVILRTDLGRRDLPRYLELKCSVLSLQRYFVGAMF